MSGYVVSQSAVAGRWSTAAGVGLEWIYLAIAAMLPLHLSERSTSLRAKALDADKGSAMTDPAEMLRPHLDEAARRLLWRRSGTPYTVRHVKDEVRRVLYEQGLVSTKWGPKVDPVLVAFFDTHPAFERVSNAPEWEPRAKIDAAKRSTGGR